MITKEEFDEFKKFLKLQTTNVLILLSKLDEVSASMETEQVQEIKDSLMSIKSIISNGVSNFKRRLERLDRGGLVWEDLCIGFFGETNAGKSTFIEALIGGDGRSIGDGRKDYTKNIRHFQYQNIKLIDMPGIEGDEKKVEMEIKKAVEKCHIIFYVTSHDKEPERETLEKVKKYLDSKTKIYSLINVKSNVDAFKYKDIKDFFEDENIKTVSERTDITLKEFFGNSFSEQILCHGLLGFLAKGKPKREDLINSQKKAFKYIGNNKKLILEMSRLNRLEELINDSLKDMNWDIVRANSFEIINEISFIIGNILKNKKSFDQVIKNLESSFIQKKEEILNTVDKYKKDVSDKINIILNEAQIQLYNIVSEGIDNKWTEATINCKIENYSQKLSQQLENEVNSIISSMNSEIERLIEEFKDCLSLQTKFLSKLNLEINLQSIMEQLKITFGYVLKQAFGIGAIILVALTGGLFGIIGGIFMAIKKIWDWFFGDPEKRKREAKQKAFMEIKTIIKDLKKKKNKEINKKISEQLSHVNNLFNNLEKHIRQIRKYIKTFNEYIMKLKQTKVEISTEMCKLLGMENISAYIDMINSKKYICIVGLTDVENKISSLMPIDYCYCFKDINDLKNSINSFDSSSRDDGTEFLKRAIDALSIKK